MDAQVILVLTGVMSRYVEDIGGEDQHSGDMRCENKGTPGRTVKGGMGKGRWSETACRGRWQATGEELGAVALIAPY